MNDKKIENGDQDKHLQQKRETEFGRGRRGQEGGINATNSTKGRFVDSRVIEFGRIMIP